MDDNGSTSTIKFGREFDAPWFVARGAVAEQGEQLALAFDLENNPDTTLVDLIVAAASKGQAMWAAAKGVAATPATVPNAVAAPQNQAPRGMPSLTCQTCGAEADFKEGTSKQGKPYKGVFCRANKDHVEWKR